MIFLSFKFPQRSLRDKISNALASSIFFETSSIYEWSKQIIMGLNHLQQIKILHGDIKPE